MTATAKRTPFVDDTDVYVPQFEIYTDGKRVSPSIHAEISQLTYQDSLTEVAALEFVIEDWDPHEQKFTYSEGDTFLPGRRLAVSIGYRGSDLFPLFDGRIVYLQPDFSRDAHPRVIVGALDLLHDLRVEQRSAVYEDKKDGEIAKEIANRLSVDLETATGGATEPKHPFLFQRNQYDVMFLLERARALGYELTVSMPEKPGAKPKLYFGPSQAGDRPEYQLTYGRSLFAFRGSLNISNQVGEVTVRSWDPLGKELLEAKSTAPRVHGIGADGGRSKIEGAFRNRREVVVDTPVADQAEATALAAAVHDDISRSMLVATGETLGLPRLRAGRKVVMDGLGERFSGSYFVTATQHRIGSEGYETFFDCRREEKG